MNLFGTDGVRGRLGEGLFTWTSLTQLALAVASDLKGRSIRRVCIGRDTRDSGKPIAQLCALVCTGMGIEVMDVGIVPTGVLAWLTVHLEGGAGIMVTASHNPASDNGIKLLDAQGRKWSAEAEERISRLWGHVHDIHWDFSLSPRLEPNAHRHYVAWMRTRFSDALSDIRVVADLACGAAVPVVPALLEEWGCSVMTVNDRLDGQCINEHAACFEPERLRQHVRAGGFDVGLAFDGDADRLLVCDDQGNIWDGDALLYLLLVMDQRDDKIHPGIVVTHMSNEALVTACAQLGTDVVRVSVGDKEVARELARRGWTLGGEPCGHLIDRETSWVSDPFVVMMRVLTWIKRYGPLSQAPRFEPYPQVTRTIPRAQVDVDALRAHMVTEYPEIRWLIRASGTEAVIRVMGEGPDRNHLLNIFVELDQYLSLPY